MSQKGFGIWLIAIVVVIGGYFTYTNFSTKEIKNVNNTVEKSVHQPNVSENQNTDSLVVAVKDITGDMKKKPVSTNGYVTKFSEGKGHVFFTLKDASTNKTINGVLFTDENQENIGRKAVLEQSYNNKILVYIDGVIDIYQNELEIKAKKVYMQ